MKRHAKTAILGLGMTFLIAIPVFALALGAVETILELPVGERPEGIAFDRSGNLFFGNRIFLPGLGMDSELRKITPAGSDTVIAKVMVHADEARTIPARFGFSDRVRVYLNGRLLFAGDDTWRARDYRFLGTIGLHGELFLPLEKGANTIWFAVTEGFGGWGVVLDLPE